MRVISRKSRLELKKTNKTKLNRIHIGKVPDITKNRYELIVDFSNDRHYARKYDGDMSPLDVAEQLEAMAYNIRMDLERGTFKE